MMNENEAERRHFSRSVLQEGGFDHLLEQQPSLRSFGFFFSSLLSSDDGESEFLPKWPLKQLISGLANGLGSFTSGVNILTSSVEADKKHLAPDVPADTLSLSGSVKFSHA